MNDLLIAYTANTLSAITTEFILSIAKFYNKRPRKNKLEIEVDGLLNQLKLNEEQINELNKFMESKIVQRHFSTFIEHRVAKSTSEGNLKLMSVQMFISCTVKMLQNYFKENEIEIPNESDLSNYITGIWNLIELKIVENIPHENQYVFNSIAHIEELLEKYIDTHSISANSLDYEVEYSQYIRLLQKYHKDMHVYGVSNLSLDKFYVFPSLKAYDYLSGNKSKILKSWKDIFKSSNIVSIIGGPGYGKTTFSKSLILKYNELNFFGAIDIVPIFCDLKTYFRKFSNKNNYSILEFVYDCMLNETGLSNKDIPFEFLEVNILKGNCLIIFDALDEVEADERDSLQKKIVNFFSDINAYNKIVITSRGKGFIPRTETIIEIKSLSIDNVKDYLNLMTQLKQPPITKKEIPAFIVQAKPLIDNNFLTSFLVLTLLISVFRAEQELPKTKNELYDKCYKYIVKTREKVGNKSKFNFENFQQILDSDHTFEELAFMGKYTNLNVESSEIKKVLSKEFRREYGSIDKSYNAVCDFLNFCEERTEFYVRGSEEDTFKFFHRSFYDYYYSKYLMRSFNEPVYIYKELLKVPTDSEVFELVSSTLKSKHYKKYFELYDLLFDKELNLTITDFNDIQKLNTISIMCKYATEKDIIDNYFSFLISHSFNNSMKKEIADFSIEILSKYNLSEKFFEYLEQDYLVELCTAFIIYGVWLYDKENFFNIFKEISYNFYDFFFGVAFNHPKHKYIPRNAVGFEEVENYIIKNSENEINPEIISYLRISYDVFTGFQLSGLNNLIGFERKVQKNITSQRLK